jgi:hypothetical protein
MDFDISAAALRLDIAACIATRSIYISEVRIKLTLPAAAEKPRSGFEVQATQWPLLTSFVKCHYRCTTCASGLIKSADNSASPKQKLKPEYIATFAAHSCLTENLYTNQATKIAQNESAKVATTIVASSVVCPSLPYQANLYHCHNA